jgi:hypothetical protein
MSATSNEKFEIVGNTPSSIGDTVVLKFYFYCPLKMERSLLIPRQRSGRKELAPTINGAAQTDCGYL